MRKKSYGKKSYGKKKSVLFRETLDLVRKKSYEKKVTTKKVDIENPFSIASI